MLREAEKAGWPTTAATVTGGDFVTTYGKEDRKVHGISANLNCSYMVDGAMYDGEGRCSMKPLRGARVIDSASASGPAADFHVEVGTEIVIYYDPESPERSVPVDPLLPSLYTAIEHGRSSDIQRHIDLGVDLTSTDEAGRTPLIWAVHCQRGNAVQTLLDAGGGKDVDGGALICMWVLTGIQESNTVTGLYLEVIEALGHFGDINFVDGSGSTVLHYAVQHWPSSRVEQLMHLGADPELTRADGATTIDIARAAGKRDIVEMLEKRKRLSTPTQVSDPP